MTMPPKSERLLSVPEVSDRLGVSAKTVRREIKTGALESIRIGPAERLIRVSERALTVYLATRNA